jgi:hypothetical protein
VGSPGLGGNSKSNAVTSKASRRFFHPIWTMDFGINSEIPGSLRH